MAEQYNKQAEKCHKDGGEDYTIRQMDIEQEEDFGDTLATLEGVTGPKKAEFTKKVSEDSIVAYHSLWKAIQEGTSPEDARRLTEEGIKTITRIIKKTSEEVYKLVTLNYEVESGDHPSTEAHRRVMAMLMPLLLDEDGDGKVDSGPNAGEDFTGQEPDLRRVLAAVDGWGRAYFAKHLTYFDAVRPDYVIGVGNDAPKGNKSDSYFITTTERKVEDLPPG